jgi:hypothetical protein
LIRRKAELQAGIETLEREITRRAAAESGRRSHPRPRIDPQSTEERFEPVEARYVKLVIFALTDQPKNGRPGGRGNPGATGTGRLTEFEVWTAGNDSRNVALLSNGGRAAGARSAVAEDFPEAYGPQFVVDGQPGEQWFIGSPAELTVTLAQVETIDRVTFSNSKGRGIADRAQGATPCEYEIQVSLDGTMWRTVADGFDRAPWSEAHGVERAWGEVITEEERSQLAALGGQLAQTQSRLDGITPLRQVWVGNPIEPTEPTRVHKGGDPAKPLDPVAPASPSFLSDAATPFELPLNAPERERRLALARWIVSPGNPLTPRVLANRVWHYHFGTGIVDTASDFGFLGGLPTHPELLDWLAARLVTHGWRLKPLHREILLSQAFRQSGEYREQPAAADRDSRLLWRFPPRRLSAEEVRDTWLTAAGVLDTRAGGPGFRLYRHLENNVSTYVPLDQHGPDTWRRAVYHQNVRAGVVDLLSDLDLPDNAFAAPRRASTTSPLQALTLLNHRFTLDMAQALAERGAKVSPSSDPRDVARGIYRLLLARDPTGAELDLAGRFIRDQGAGAFCRAMLNLNEVLYVD